MRLPNAQLTHLGLYVEDLPKMKAFYRTYLGLVVSDEGDANGRRYAFMTRNEEEHHQLVLATGRTPGRDIMVVNQLSFRVDDLGGLRAYYSILEEANVDGLEARNHGNSWSLYFFDPEGNKIEMYTVTPWHVSMPWRAPLDLSKTDDEIATETEELIRSLPSTKPIEDWRKDIGARIRAG